MRPRPAFFIVCGDLVDAYASLHPDIRCRDIRRLLGIENNKHLHDCIRMRQESDFKAVYSELHPSIPLVCVCGNHDVGDTPSNTSIRQYKAAFGDDYFSFYRSGCCFLVLNSQLYADSSQVTEGIYFKLSVEFENVFPQVPDHFSRQEAWLEAELVRARSLGVRHIMVFQVTRQTRAERG